MPFNQNLTNAEARKVWRDIMHNDNARYGDLSCTKDELRQFIDTADQWVTDNVSGVYQALDPAIRTKLSAEQRAKILLAVMDKKINS